MWTLGSGLVGVARTDSVPLVVSAVGSVAGGCVVPCSPSDPPPIPVSWRPLPSPAARSLGRVPATPAASLPERREARALPQPRPAASGLISGCAQYFAATPTAAAWARRHTADVLGRWGVAEMTEDVCLVVSELVGNAVRHAVTPETAAVSCRLVLKLFVDVLAVEVWDPSPSIVAPVVQNDPLSESGRGLAIVEAVCGAPVLVYTEPGAGKTVVAVVPRPADGLLRRSATVGPKKQ